MSILAALAAKTARDEELLGQINDALLQVQLEAAGKAQALGYTAEHLQASRQILLEFLEILAKVISRAQRGELKAPQSQTERAAENILVRLDEQGKPREDWLEDVNATIERLKTGASIETEDWALLETMVDFLDSELARDLVALSQV